MISILFDPVTQIAKLAFTLPITAGADVPVLVTFSPTPGEVSAIQLGLVSDVSAPATLAYTEDFSEENPSAWTATLDANDTRLLLALNGKTSLQVTLALVCVIDGVRLVNTVLRLTVNPPVLVGPEASEGGPNYYTDAQTTAAIAAAIAAALAGMPAAAKIPTSEYAVTGLTGGGSSNLDGLATASGARSVGALVAINAPDKAALWRLKAGTDAAVADAKVRPTDYHATTNAVFWEALL